MHSAPRSSRRKPRAGQCRSDVQTASLNTPTGAEGQGGTGGTTAQACLGAGVSYVGPAIGQIATVIGPTIISPGFVGP